MKYELIILLALVGGMFGFAFHLIWHFKLDIPLIIFSSHIMTGVFQTLIGIMIGGVIGHLLNRKYLK